MPRTAWIVPGIAIAAALAIALTGANRPLFLLLNGASRLTGPAVWPQITILGDTAVTIALFLPLALHRRDLLWPLALSALIATLFVHGFKPFWQIPRPPAVLPADAFTVIGPARRANSFPSGHTATIFVAAALVWLHVDHAWARCATLALAAGVGLSRIVVGVHWPLDVTAGAAGGWLSAMAGTALAQRLPLRDSRASQALLLLIGSGAAAAALAGLDTGYPQALPLERAIGACAIAAVTVQSLRRLGHVVREAHGPGQ